MKLLKKILCFGILSLSIGCFSDDDKKEIKGYHNTKYTVLEDVNADGTINEDEITYFFTTEYDSRGNKIRQKGYSDSNGDMIATDSEPNYMYLFEYDNNNNKILEKNCNDKNSDGQITDNEISHYTKFEYNNNNQLIKEIDFFDFGDEDTRDNIIASDEIQEITEYQYNSNGMEIAQNSVSTNYSHASSTPLSLDATLTSSWVSEYDANNNLVRKYWMLNDSEVFSRITDVHHVWEYTYDSSGNKISLIEYYDDNHDGNFTENEANSKEYYQYDSKGNMIRRERCMDLNADNTITRDEIVYISEHIYNNNNLVTEIKQYGDLNGTNITQPITTDNIKSKYTYTYFNEIETTKFYKNTNNDNQITEDELSSITINEYTPFY